MICMSGYRLKQNADVLTAIALIVAINRASFTAFPDAYYLAPCSSRVVSRALFQAGNQSARIAIVGSIRAALNAGASAAMHATTRRNKLAAPRVSGSRGPTPNSIALSALAPQSASNMPTPTPIPAIAIAWPTTNPTTSLR